MLFKLQNENEKPSQVNKFIATNLAFEDREILRGLKFKFDETLRSWWTDDWLKVAQAEAIYSPVKAQKIKEALALYDDCHWQAYITVEGYSKMLNCHPGFDGIVFTESPELTNGVPIWMECTIYRKDRRLPIVIREYFEEVKGEQAIWQKMPRRMLRHRAMQQCARLAIG